MDPAPTDTKSRKKSPRDQANFWRDEIDSSQKLLRRVHKQGIKVVKRYLDDRGIGDGRGEIQSDGGQFRINLFNSNITTLQSMLYSSLPKVEADRTFADSKDDVARVAADMLERLINLDIADNGEEYDCVLKSALQDRLLPGLGCARVRYEFEEEEFMVAAQVDANGMEITKGYMDTRIVSEDAPVEYYHWQDVCWGWGRSFAELPWFAFRSYLSKDEVEARFGAKFKDKVTYRTQRAADATDDSDDSRKEDDAPWQKAEIWEIWDKEMRQVVWYSKGCATLLDKKQDPLQLNQFFPCPPLMLANPTTALYRPVADFHLSQDWYNEIDVLQTRISLLTTAVKVVGVYDSSAEGVTRMMKEGFENDLIPVDSWAMFAETGGLQGAIDWMPVLDIVTTLDKLRDLLASSIGMLQQVNGMSDVMQGGLDNQYEGVGQTQIKAQFGSVRIQALQDQFAQFAGDLLQLKAEVICKHYQPETIVKQSNMEFSFDAELLQPAVQLLKQPEMAHVRIKVRPETVAMVDYARLKSDRTEFLTAMSTFMQSAAPILEKEPDAMPALLQMLQWTMAGFKGSSEIEGVLDKLVEGAEQKAKQPKEDPNAAAAAAEQAKLQGEMQKIQAKSQADLQLRQADLQADMQTIQAQSQAKQGEIMAANQAALAEIQAKAQADMMNEQASMQANIAQTEAGADAETMKDAMATQLDLEATAKKMEMSMEENAQEAELDLAKTSKASLDKLNEMIASASLKAAENDDDDDE